jgi:hypothetical protein
MMMRIAYLRSLSAVVAFCLVAPAEPPHGVLDLL